MQTSADTMLAGPVKFVKMNGRHRIGHSYFTHYVEFNGAWAWARRGYQDYFKCRNWCWDVWGPSCEVERYSIWLVGNVTEQPPGWAWLDTDSSDSKLEKPRIYLAGDAVSLFLLRWNIA
jgi:hypothetical protein